MSSSEHTGEPARQIGARLQALAMHELQRAVDLLGRGGPRVHEGVHQARKSMRRTRAVLALGMPALGAGTPVIDRELQHVIRGLSRLRDVHALVGIVDHLLEKEPRESDAADLLRRARRSAMGKRAAVARDELRDDPGLHVRREILRMLRAALQGLAWSAVGEAGVEAALGRSADRITAASERAHASGRDEDWHRWRRRARRLAQQQTALGDAAPSLAGEGKRVALLLGEAQDCAMLIAYCDRKSGLAKGERERLREFATTRLARVRARIAERAVP